MDFADFSDGEHRQLLRWCYRLTKNMPDAEDLAQSAILKAMRYRFDGRCSRRTWLAMMARQIFIDGLRRRRIRELQPLEGVDVAVDCTEQRVIEARRSLDVLLADLPEYLRGVLEDRFLRGMTIDEVSRCRGVTSGAIKSYQFRAMQRVREAHGIDVNGTC